MKLSAYNPLKSYVKRIFESAMERVALVKASVIYNIQIETAYLTDLWGNMLSTLFYTLATVIFIDVLYSNVETFVSYTRAEMLLYFFIGQPNFYTIWGISYQGLEALILDVKNGDLDLILLKPLPTLFYLETRKFHLIRSIRDSFVPMILLFFVVPWSELKFSLVSVFSGILIMIMGIIIIHVFLLLFSLPVFWIGESQNYLTMSMTIYTLSDARIPYEGFSNVMKVVFSFVLPLLWTTQVSTSVMLGKSDSGKMLLFCCIVTFIFLLLRPFFWRKALIAYSSASS